MNSSLLFLQFSHVSLPKAMVEANSLRQDLDLLNPCLFKLLRWIIATNRCHLALLPPKDQIKKLKTPHQFILKSSPPDKEVVFQRLKKNEIKSGHSKDGSFFAVHGSSWGNWHSILRNGLQNKGYRSAHGPGIYLAKDAGTSVSYASSNSCQNWPHSMYGKSSVVCMALCEIVDHGTKSACLGKVHQIGCNHKTSSPFFRVEDEEYLVTRFLCIWPSDKVKNVPKDNVSSYKGIRSLVDFDLLKSSKDCR